MEKIICVEDDDNIRTLLTYTLNKMGYEAVGFTNGETFLEQYSQPGQPVPNLVLLDIMLPGNDGNQILQRMKQSERLYPVPVIMLTAKGNEADKVMALDHGADDYVTKPFGMMELLSRIRAVLRRCASGDASGEEPVLCLGGICLDHARRKVTLDDTPLALTLKEYQLLKKLMEHPDIVFTRNQLVDDLWGHDFVGESRTLDVHIATLRQKLGDYGRWIETIRGVGYRMRSVPL